ncbi:hypothetical protein RHMOL_Rhmol08G0039000 [Rhododendron molle]|uniref:Uncharacterized protein n=1 Tax=Rhododendron molle TaxID=49168 RepID=A0ACC0MJB7_RHOML|nr:hypothetical protein RHMOL_Rhmol08G0039000 [Rhododendron molle]
MRPPLVTQTSSSSSSAESLPRSTPSPPRSRWRRSATSWRRRSRSECFSRGTLNRGPFNGKEHVLIAIFANAGLADVHPTHVVTAVKVFNKQNMTFFVALAVVVTTQVLGFGLAGICRRF